MNKILIKSMLWWLIFIPLAIINGILREYILNAAFGPQIALPLSGVTLSFLILVITWLIVPHFKSNQSETYWKTGILWLILTIAFEFSFGYFVSGKSLHELLKAYNILSGNLWLLVLINTLFAPYIAARLRKII